MAIVYGLQKYRCYLYGMEFVVLTDHVNHKSLLTKANPFPQIARWLITIMDYKFKIVYKPGNLHRDADEISRHPVYSPEDSEPTEMLTM